LGKPSPRRFKESQRPWPMMRWSSSSISSSCPAATISCERVPHRQGDGLGRHHREVVATIPPEWLLVFDVKEGWQQLCVFLGVPVPVDEPFPHVNDAADFTRRQRDQYRHIAAFCSQP
jgi:hypothetical protein